MKTLKTIGQYTGIVVLCLIGLGIFCAMAWVAFLFQAAESQYHQEQGHVTASGVQD